MSSGSMIPRSIQRSDLQLKINIPEDHWEDPSRSVTMKTIFRLMAYQMMNS